jgi:hypothetical protein
MRWQAAFLAHQDLAIAAAEDYLAQPGAAAIVPCDGRLAANLGGQKLT